MQEAEPPEWLEGRLSKELLLCVDDDASSLCVRQVLLETRGFRVLCASSGEEGLALFGSHAIDLVVLDYEMPRLKGDAVASAMKLLKPDVPILLLSSLPPATATRLVDAVVEKADGPVSLLAEICGLLKAREGHRRLSTSADCD
jgi:CheY-like chemotaxis protein